MQSQLAQKGVTKVTKVYDLTHSQAERRLPEEWENSARVRGAFNSGRLYRP